MKLLGVVILLLVTVAGIALFFGARGWRKVTETLISELHAGRAVPVRSIYDESELAGLPAPVERFFRTVLREGQPVVLGARLAQVGEFRMSEAEDSWKPFEAAQIFRTAPPAFIWDARIKMAPGLTVRVRDMYQNGVGTMKGAVLGVFPVVDIRGEPEIAVAALQRYLAESVWFPTALLPSHGVRWSPIDALRARATLTDGEVTASLEFRFSGTGEIESVFAESRFREVKGTFEPTPWEGRFAEYEVREGMRVPTRGEVAWYVDSRELPYWRGRLVAAQYEWPG